MCLLYTASYILYTVYEGTSPKFTFTQCIMFAISSMERPPFHTSVIKFIDSDKIKWFGCIIKIYITLIK